MDVVGINIIGGLQHRRAFDQPRLRRAVHAVRGVNAGNAQDAAQGGAPVEELDIEGLYARPGRFWLGVEGSSGAGNRIVRLEALGEVAESVALPADIVALTGSNGIEGVTAITDTGGEHVFVAMQRTAPALGTPTVTRIGRYDVLTRTWSWYGYTLEPSTAPVDWFSDWVGLSEIVAVDANTLAVIERDKLNGPNASNKRIYTVTLPARPAAPRRLRSRWRRPWPTTSCRTCGLPTAGPRRSSRA